MPPADQEAWKRLGRLLADRRVQIAPRYKNKNLFAGERGINRRMLWQIETGARGTYRGDTLRAIEVAYMLVPGSIDRALEGSDLQPLPAAAPRIAAVAAPASSATAAARLFALDNIRALIPGAGDVELGLLETLAGEAAEGDEWLEALYAAPNPRREGERLPLLMRVDFMIAWLRDDPRRALDDEGRRGTA